MSMIRRPTRKCARCKARLPRADFGPGDPRQGGLDCYCLACRQRAEEGKAATGRYAADFAEGVARRIAEIRRAKEREAELLRRRRLNQAPIAAVRPRIRPRGKPA